jgi:lysozyme
MNTSSRLAIAGALTAAGILAVTVVAKHEGLRTKAYRDVVGVPTVCFGETRGVKMGDQYTVDECKKMLGKALTEFEAGMLKCLKNPAAIPDKTYVAFLSFAYNVGIHGACKSSIFRAANAGDLKTACNRLPLWNKAGGRTIRGLVKRRDDERALCLEGLK